MKWHRFGGHFAYSLFPYTWPVSAMHATIGLLYTISARFSKMNHINIIQADPCTCNRPTLNMYRYTKTLIRSLFCEQQHARNAIYSFYSAYSSRSWKWLKFSKRQFRIYGRANYACLHRTKIQVSSQSTFRKYLYIHGNRVNFLSNSRYTRPSI
jgi:hypothetical protein